MQQQWWPIVMVIGLAAAGTVPAVAVEATDEQVWQRFVSWLPTTQPSDDPLSLMQSYRAHLVANKVPSGEADRHLSVIRSLMRTRQDGWQQIFNVIYASKTPGFSTRPNALLVSSVERRKPGRALDVGMGQGRNSVFLAMRGWDVTGFDVSDEGLAVARRNAASAGVKITALQKSHDAFDFGTAQWDLIVITYEPFPVTADDYVQRVMAALRPGGSIVIESFASDAMASGRRPVDIDPAALLKAFQQHRILHFEDKIAMPDWTSQETRVVRLVAERR